MRKPLFHCVFSAVKRLIINISNLKELKFCEGNLISVSLAIFLGDTLVHNVFHSLQHPINCSVFHYTYYVIVLNGIMG